MTAIAASAAAEAAGGGFVSGAFNVAAGILTNALGFGFVSFLVISLINPPEGNNGTTILNIALAAGTTWLAGNVFSNLFGGSVPTHTAGFHPGPSVENLTNYIGKCESGLDWNIVHGGGHPLINGHPISECSINQVYNWQINHPDRLAAGAHQFVPSTLLHTADYLNLPMSTIFSPETQNLMAAGLLENIGLNDYVAGTLTDGEMLKRITDTWVAPMNRDVLLNSLHEIKRVFPVLPTAVMGGP